MPLKVTVAVVDAMVMIDAQRRSVGRVAVASKIGRKRVVPGRDQRADFETKQSQANYNAVKAL